MFVASLTSALATDTRHSRATMSNPMNRTHEDGGSEARLILVDTKETAVWALPRLD